MLDHTTTTYHTAMALYYAGRLDHLAVSNLVQSIPDLTADEQKFIIGYIYQSDKNGDGLLSFDEFKAVVASFGNKANGAGQFAGTSISPTPVLPASAKPN